MTREEAIEVLEHNCPSACFTDLFEAVVIAIQALSAEPEDKCGECDAWNQYKNYPRQQWIPCSEWLPEDGTEVFVYLFDSPSPYIAWIEDTHWYTEDFEVDREDEPIAWMPLPEPYREERRTDD